MRKAHIISIGNELLIGDTINTNASWIGRFLTEKGFFVEQVITLPDDYILISECVEQSFMSSDFTVVTGGLGPTHDDITKKVITDFFDDELVENEAVLNHIKEIFRKRDFEFSRSNADQALVPKSCTVLFNNQGTAPGMWFEKENRALAVLPGVPYEMQFLMNNGVSDKLNDFFPGQDVWATRYYKTAGVPESTLSDGVVGDLSSYLNNGVQVAYLPNPGGVTIRISAEGNDKSAANNKLEKLQELLYKKAGEFIYGEGRDCQLAAVVGDLLKQNNKTIAVAESCTGGMLSNDITDVAGSSSYMLGGVIAYANDVKINHLGVNENDLKKYGAVSKQVALQMAKGVAESMGSSIGVSTTGIAGPGGGSVEKPVGTVWMGFWMDGKSFALKAQFTNDRLINKQRTVMVVLETIRREILGLGSYPYNLKPQQ
ncbi:MAG: competence/damage-inducible protein A [Balneolaceae bacterium]